MGWTRILSWLDSLGELGYRLMILSPWTTLCPLQTLWFFLFCNYIWNITDAKQKQCRAQDWPLGDSWNCWKWVRCRTKKSNMMTVCEGGIKPVKVSSKTTITEPKDEQFMVNSIKCQSRSHLFGLCHPVVIWFDPHLQCW